MGISKMLTVSTAHIRKETAEFIENVCIDNTLSKLIVYDKTAHYNDCSEEYGWFIYCNVNLPDLKVPTDLLKLIKFTKSSGCDWLCLDRDAEIVDGLDFYEW